MTVALDLAQFFTRTGYADLPPLALDHARVLISSTLASAAAGSSIESARIIKAIERERGGREDATVWFDAGPRLPAVAAARVNAVQTAAAASDDSDLRNVAHTGTTVVSIVLALAEKTGASGRDVLEAIVLGYEAAGRIGESLSNRGGFHACVIVSFGAAVAASKLLKLTAEQMSHAICLNATSIGGLGISTNSWGREYHDGQAVLSGMHAAFAAQRGFTVNPDMLENPRGFLQLFGGKVDTEPLTRDLGAEWDIVTHMAVKLVPGAHMFHPAVEAAALAAQKANLPAEDVAHIYVSGPRGRGMPVANPHRPADLIEAIHSLPYFLASAVADRDFGWIHATEEKIHSPQMHRLLDLVESDPSPPDVHYDWDWGGTVTIVAKSGERFTATVDAPRGSGPRGIDWADIDLKYDKLMPESGLDAVKIAQAKDVIHNFDNVKQVTELTGLLV
jgi:2-methylcitrate dehydratase PrpD